MPGNVTDVIRTLDLFCGGGGSSSGAAAAGATIVGAVDAWQLAADTYADNFPEALVSNGILDRHSGRRLFPGVGKIDLLLASPECTNHTCARGSRKRNESSRNTALFVLNYVEVFNPRWVVIENVVQMRSWSKYERLVSHLRRHYQVSPQVLDASNFGVPQSRKRLFIVCDRDRKPADLTNIRTRHERCAADILDPPGKWISQPLYSARRAPETLKRAARAISELGEGIPFLLVYYGTDGAGGWQSLDRPLRTITTLDRFGLVEWGTGEPTLRMLQVPELQRAMGFSPSYKLVRGSRRDRIKLLGNAVCPPVMHAIVESLVGTKSEAAAAPDGGVPVLFDELLVA